MAYFIIYFVPLPLPSTVMIPFLPIFFSNCVVLDFPKGTQGAISLIDFSIILLKVLYTPLSSSVRSRSFSKIGSTVLIVFSDT